MKLDDRNKEIPEEFKKLSEDFSKNGFITTSLDNLINSSLNFIYGKINIIIRKRK